MADILLIKCNMFVSNKQLQDIFNYLIAQKETGVILLPPYLEAQLVPGDTIIECERRRNCEAVQEYLKKEKKNNAEN